MNPWNQESFKIIHQCAHCVEDMHERCSQECKKFYCKHCDTEEKRCEMDKNNLKTK